MDYEQTLRERILINQRAEEDQGYRRDILFQCAENPTFWCNNFAWTYDPRKQFYSQDHLPFIMFPKQIEYLQWLNWLLLTNKDGAIEKSRDMGVSYVTLIPFVLHHWLFDPAFKAKLGSRKEEYVDKPGDMDALFEKIVYNLKRLPSWMLPEGFSLPAHKTYMKLVRPDNTNTVTGESANESFGRGGRLNVSIFDEHAFWPFAQASWEAAGESTPTRVSISTPPPSGRSSFFYKNIVSGRVQTFSFHYKDDTRKDMEWERSQRAKKTEEEFERELNISYEGSLEGTVYAANLAKCELGTFEYDPNKPLYVSWDFGLDGTAMQWYQWDQKIDHWYLIDSFCKANEDITFFIPFVTGTILSGFEYTDAEIEKIAQHKYWQPASHVGDPDVAKRSYTNKSLSAENILRKYGIYVQTKPWTQDNTKHYLRKQQTISFLRKLSVDEKHNEYFMDCIRNARYPKRAENSQSTTEIREPIHDWTSHHRTSLEYMSDNAPTRQTGVSRVITRQQFSVVNKVNGNE